MNEGCNCMETIKQRLTEYHGENSQVELKLEQTINTKTLERGVAISPLYYTYRVLGKKRKKCYVPFNFCPFCGAKNGREE